MRLKWQRISLGSYGGYYQATDKYGRVWTLEQTPDYSWDIKCDDKYRGTAYPPQALSEAKARASVMVLEERD